MISLDQLELTGKRVFVRVDFNVPLKGATVTDATRIDAALPTIRYAIEHGARVILASHLGRPKGKVDSAFSLAPVRAVLEAKLGQPVGLAPDCIGPAVEQQVAALGNGQVLLLENLRFHTAEEKNEPGFAAALARLADVYVNDAFGTAHRAHASTAGMVPLVATRAAGFLLQRECDFLGRILAAPERPLVAILGGAKVSDKIKVIESLLGRVDSLLIGGAMAYTFLRAQGLSTGTSLVEEAQIGLAGGLLTTAQARGVRLLLPVDHVVAPSADSASDAVTVRTIPADKMGLDIGAETVAAFRAVIAEARTVFWNGPLGMFEVAPFDAGTMAVAAAVADSRAVSVIGGGDSVAAIMRSGRSNDITHISTGGGASLEFLEGVALPGLVALES
ncbi:MAG: phosphoglycerate kinase [Deltaproteobacteria bacterium]|nr:phosphoglycerate kinase [Deltaproteobacteria bacterium]